VSWNLFSTAAKQPDRELRKAYHHITIIFEANNAWSFNLQYPILLHRMELKKVPRKTVGAKNLEVGQNMRKL
jgi:hypothetical protein